MIKNYFKIAWRNIIKNRFYSAVNLVGLSTGIAFTLLIGAYIWSQLQVNSNLKNVDRQYIIQSKWKDANQGINLTTLGPLAKVLRENYPDLVANYFRWDGVSSNVSKGDKSYREGLQICDSTMFKMYGFSLLHGDPQTAFEGPFSLVITAEKAKKYFGKTDVVGQTLTIENFSGAKHDFMITGVLNEPPKNSVTYLNDDNNNQFFVSSGNLAYFGRNMDWPNRYIVSYIELQKGITPEDLVKPMQYLIKQNAPPQIAEAITPYLVSLKDYYLSANNSLIKKMLYALSAIALFILLMAIINFINMSVSRSATRMREIGIRKVLGGLKKQLILQFLIESVLLVFFATIFSFVIYMLSKNLFGNILITEMPSLTDFPVYFLVFPLLLIVVIGFMAGIYPSFVLSSLKSVDSLKGKLSSVKNVLLRKSFVAFQFGIATVALIGAIIISKQINLFLSKDLGFNKDYILTAQLPRNWTPEGVHKMENLRNQFAAMPQVKNVTLSWEVPDGNSAGGLSIYKVGADSTTAISSQLLMTDEYYASTFGIPMAAGVFFSTPGAFTDSLKVVINETQAKAFGWNNPQDAIGKRVKFQNRSGQIFTVAGVTKDFHFESMQKAIQPVTFLHVNFTNVFRNFSFKIKAGNISNSIAAIQKKWSALMPGTPFEYTFMDETLAKLYKSEIQLKKASYTASALALTIALLGVLGLISLSIQKRTKEIGIRKVLGSSVTGIISLFIKEFLLVITIGGLIACPFAYLIMHNWLQNYAYRINMTAKPFIFSIVFLGLVTALLICIQTIKTAISNPVESLRSE